MATLDRQMGQSPICLSKGTPPIRKIDFFRALPEKGGGRALPEFFDPFFHHVVPYILTSISCYVILFGNFINNLGLLALQCCRFIL